MAVTGWRGVGLHLQGDGDLVQQVVSHLPEFYDAAPSPTMSGRVFEEDGAFVLEVEGERPSRLVPSYSSLLDIAHLVELLVVERLTDVVAIHAGVVAVSGHALLLPGSTRTGKSRLVAALVQAGATYLSDEFALLNDVGMVLPYPRPLGLRDGHHYRPVDTATLGPLPTESAYPVAAAAFLRYDEQAIGLQGDELGAGDLWRHLMQHCISANRRPGAAFSAATTLAAASRGFSGTRGEAPSACDELLAFALP